MSVSLNQENAYIFRIIHIDNMKSVLENGCQSRTLAAAGSYNEIGNADLIQRRVTREVPCDPNGTLSDYVPFYFTPYSPMLYNIKTGYGVPQQKMSDIVILISSLHRLISENVPFVFTDRHAYLKTAQFSNNLEDLNWIIWSALQQRNFKKDDIQKFEKYQAEALVHNIMPIKSLLGIVCYDDQKKELLEQMARESSVRVDIKTMPNWYL